MIYLLKRSSSVRKMTDTKVKQPLASKIFRVRGVTVIINNKYIFGAQEKSMRYNVSDYNVELLRSSGIPEDDIFHCISITGRFSF